MRYLNQGRLWIIGFLAIAGVIVLWLAAQRPSELERQISAAQQALAAGQYAQAAQNYARAAEISPERLELWSQAGAAAWQGGDVQSAIDYFERNSQLTQTDHFLLGQAYQQSGDLAQAITHYQQAASPDAYLALSQIHRTQRDYPAIQLDLQALVALAPQNADYAYQLGLLLAALEPEASLLHLQRAAQLNPGYAPVLAALEEAVRTSRFYDDPAYTYLAAGRALAALNKWELAGEAFRRSVAQNEGYGEAWAYLAEANQQLGLDGSNEIAQALLLTPSSVAVNLLAGLYWQRKGDSSQALAYLDAAAKLDPENPVLQAEIGHTLSEMGDLPLAELYYRRAIELAPKDPVYPRMLAEFALQHDIQIHEMALPAARQALLLDPDDPAILNVMAHVLLRLGDALTAERFLLQAIAIVPDDPAAHLRLGQVYWLRGEVELARQEWQRVQTLVPQSAWAQEAQRWLER